MQRSIDAKSIQTRDMRVWTLSSYIGDSLWTWYSRLECDSSLASSTSSTLLCLVVVDGLVKRRNARTDGRTGLISGLLLLALSTHFVLSDDSPAAGVSGLLLVQLYAAAVVKGGELRYRSKGITVTNESTRALLRYRLVLTSWRR